MRKAAFGLVLLLIVLGIAPGVLGIQTENMIVRQITTFDDNPFLTLGIDSYERGWFNSRATVSIGVDSNYFDDALDPSAASALGLGNVAEDQTVTVNVDIDHGPIVIGDGFFVGLSRFVAQLDPQSQAVSELQTRFAMPYLITLKGEVGFTGNLRYAADVPPIDYADEDGELMFSGALLAGTFAGGRLTTNGSIESMIYDSGSSVVSMQSLRITGENQIISRYLNTGTMEFAIDGLSVTDPFGSPEPLFSATGIRVITESHLDDTGELMTATISYAADSITASSADVDIEDAELAIRVANLAVDTLNRYYDTVLSAASNDAVMANALMQLASDALAREPSLAIDPLSFRLSGEPFIAHIEVRTNGNATQSTIDFANPIALLGLIEASADATASKVLAERLATQALTTQLALSMSLQDLPPGQDLESMAAAQVQVMLAGLLAQGMLVASGDNYTTRIEFASGNLTVNGNPLPLGMF